MAVLRPSTSEVRGLLLTLLVIRLCVVILRYLPVATSLAVLLIVISLVVMARVSVSSDCRIRLVSAEETHIVDNGTPAILLTQKRQKLEHQLIVCYVSLSEHTLDLFEVPLGQL